MFEAGRNIKYAARQLLKSPGFTIVAVLIFALGIGANSAIFSVVNGVLLEPLPFRNPDRLVQLWHTPPQSSFPGITRFAISAANFLDWQRQNHVFEEMSLYSFGAFDLTGNGKPESIRSGAVTSSFFSVLGVQPLYGRIFTADEDQPGRNHEAILTYGFWKRHYGGDPGVIGRTMNLDGTAYLIVGVMGPRMTTPHFAQIWTPLGLTPKEAAVRGEHHYMAIARLKPGVTLSQAQNEMNTISHRLEIDYPADDKGWGAQVISMRDNLVGDVRPALLMLLGAVGFVLLIACANVANLMLGRAFARRKEIAIRTALGASRSGVIQLLVMECLLVAIAAGALGLYTAHFGIDLLIKFFADKLPRMGDIGLNGKVLLFTLALSIVTGALAGLLPAISMTRGDVNDSLKQGLGRMDEAGSSGLTRSALVTIEVALSLVLLVGAGLMVRSLWKLQTIDPGFDAHDVLTASLEIRHTQFTSPEQEMEFLSSTLQRIRALPGVESAATIDNLPLQGGSNQPIAISGQPVKPMSEQPEVSVRVVTPGYFQTMKIPLLAGRVFNWDDKPGAAAAVVISKSMANQFWPHQNPIGQHLTLTFSPDRERVVVGVVGDVKQHGLDTTAGTATLYWPLAQVGASMFGPWRAFGLSLVVRTSVAPLTLSKAVSNAVGQVNGNVPVDNVISLEDLVGETLTQNKFNMQLLAIFGALAVVLCIVGIYSVLAYSVRRRMRDIGLRLAFGASLADVARLVIVEGMKPTLAGIGVGLLCALGMGRIVSSLIYGISSRDLTTFLFATVLLVAIAFTASLLPALRATRVDPLTVLRDE